MNATKLNFIHALKRKNFIILAFVLVFSASNLALTQSNIGIKTVIIDAGHGGKDPGAVGPTKVQEKDVVLNVALKIGGLISKKYPTIKVIYTRSKDEFIGLAERAHIANKHNADLFISLHCNAADNKAAHGIETWVLGLHKSEAALEVAKKENAAILMEDGHNQKYQDFDPNDPDSYIALTYGFNVYREQSHHFAHLVQRKCVNDLKRNDRMVKAAGFMVLYRAAMPSVLIELGFLSNPEEEKYLASAKGQEELSLKIFEAFEQYKEYIDKKNGVTPSTSNNLPKNNEADSLKKSNDVKNDNSSTTNNGIIFKVQIASSATNLDTKPENFKGLKNIQKAPAGNLYRYFIGDFNSYAEAKLSQDEAKKIGYETAFIVAYENGNKIDVKLAIEKSNTK